MLSKEKNSEFLGLIEKIKSSDYIIIVEGKKDRASLEMFGFDSERIVELSRKPLFIVVEEVSEMCEDGKKCIILTDLDKEGRKLYSRLNRELQKRGVKVDNRLRVFLFKETKIRQIEGLGNL